MDNLPVNFWPGILTPDSIVQWGQAVAKVLLDNRNPAIYTLLIRLLTTAFNTPAIVAFAQILALSLVTAGGIRFLESTYFLKNSLDFELYHGFSR